MYTNYKTGNTKANIQKSQQGKLQEKKGTPIEKKPKPQWNDAVKDDNSYRLSASEQVQRKVSLISKHRLEAKEEWHDRQDKLKRGIIDDETKRVYDTARQSKNLSICEEEFQRKNLSQMLNFIPKLQNNKSKTIIEDVQQNLEETRQFIQKVEQYKNDDDPNRLLRVMDRLSKNTDLNNTSQKQYKTLKKPPPSFHTHNERSLSTSKSKLNTLQNEAETAEKDELQQLSQCQKENKQEIANYFNSLDKIQETIKFMENNILCDKKLLKQPTPPLINPQNNTLLTQESNLTSHIKSHTPSLNTPLNKQVNISRSSRSIDNEAISFNLSDSEEQEQFQLGHSKSKQQTNPFENNRINQTVFTCNIQTIDPTTFFNEEPINTNNIIHTEIEHPIKSDYPKTSSLPSNSIHVYNQLQQLEVEDDYFSNQKYLQQNYQPTHSHSNSFPIPQQQQHHEQEGQEEEEEEEDFLSRNIDSLKEMLEATKRDLDKLESKPFTEEINYFESIKQSSLVESKIQGKKTQNEVQIITRNETNLNKNINNPRETSGQSEQYIKHNQSNKISPPSNIVENNFFEAERTSQNTFTSNMFISNGKDNNYSQQSSQINNHSYTHQSDANFTSNMFLNKKQEHLGASQFQSNNNHQMMVNPKINPNPTMNQYCERKDEVDSDIPQQLNIVKQDIFKKSIQNYSQYSVNPQQSLNIKHYLK